MVVVGAGIVGLATAWALQKRRAGRIAVLEAEAELARHQSGRNSGILHSGLYYRPGSAKARLCARGREALYAFCEAHGVPFARTGKVVVAATDRESATLEELADRGRANGLEPALLDGAALRELEPNVAGVAALHVKETGLVDFREVTRTLATLLTEGGAGGTGATPLPRAEVRTDTRALHIAEGPRSVRVRTTRGAVEAGALVNCAGLQADRVARAAGLRPGVRIIPFRGDYFQVRAWRAGIVRRPVYPVPDPALPFLGVHLHPTLDGRLEAGPNAVLSLSRSRYSPPAFRPVDALETLAWAGFWRMAATHWRTALEEGLRALSRRRLAVSLQRLVPLVGADDLRRSRSGLRAQAVDGKGRLVDDFHFVKGERSLHVLNSPSPAATAALAIGEEIAGGTVAEGWI